MLQITTGKFFKHGIGRENRLRGVLYSNYRANYGEAGLETAAGRLTSSSNLSGIRSIIFEFTERWEAPPASQVLSSIGADHFLNDMGAVLSFALDITCTPDLDLARRLLGDAPLAPNASGRPRQYLARVFEAQLYPRAGDDEHLVKFVANLLALDRKHYMAAMRSIRTYVGGLQRLGDDVDLAYTLLVASMESLAQGFDKHKPVWDDYAFDKRERIDRALKHASEPLARGVRQAILEIEHVSLARRFIAYTLHNLGTDYFRNESPLIGRADLTLALEEAYSIRSKYLHTLQAVPRQIALANDRGEYVHVRNKPALTVQGLARVARKLISVFVETGSKSEFEDYNYVLDVPGVMQAELAPEYWIAKHEGFAPAHATKRLSGLLEIYAEILLGQRTAFTDMSELLRKCETIIPKAKKQQRLTILALYYLYNVLLQEPDRLDGWREIIDRYGSILDEPSVESLLLHVVLERPLGDWNVGEIAKHREDYMRRRYRTNGLKAPWLFEVAMDLRLAEEYRLQGNELKARETILETIENHPSVAGLSALEKGAGVALSPISWRNVLLPEKPNAADT